MSHARLRCCSHCGHRFNGAVDVVLQREHLSFDMGDAANVYAGVAAAVKRSLAESAHVTDEDVLWCTDYLHELPPGVPLYACGV